MEKGKKLKFLILLLIGFILAAPLCWCFFSTSSLSAEESIYRDTERLLELAYETNTGPIPPDEYSWYGGVGEACWAYLQENVIESQNQYHISSSVTEPINGRIHGVNQVSFANGNSVTLVYYQTWIVDCKTGKTN